MHKFFLVLAAAAVLVLAILGIAALGHVAVLLFETVARRGWQWGEILGLIFLCSFVTLFVAAIGVEVTRE